MWEALTEQLLSDHTVISPADRAQLIDDAFSLCMAGRNILNSKYSAEEIYFTHFGGRRGRTINPFYPSLHAIEYHKNEFILLCKKLNFQSIFLLKTPQGYFFIVSFFRAFEAQRPVVAGEVPGQRN